jgi:predicted dehydrogenase
MVGHVLLFHPAVRRLKELVDHGSLGEVYYLTSQRVGPPNVRRQESVLWDLGVHDVAVVLYLLGDQPVEAGARADSYVKAGIADVVVASLAFATGIRAHIQLSRLEGVPTRRLTAVGSRSTAVFEELERERPLTVFDHDPLGEISSPRLPWEEPLRAECAHFVEAVRSSAEPVAGVREGAAVVNVLEALARSAEHGGVGEAVGGIEARPDVIRLPARTS